MRKRLAALLLIVAVIAAFFVFRNPSTPGSGAAPSAAPTPAPPGRKPRPLPANAPPKGSGSAAPDSTASAEPNGRPVFSAKWGSGPDQLGHDLPQEANAIGPMSFAVDGRGRIVVLDGVNGRLVRRTADGKVDKTIPIGVLEAHDMAIGPDGSTAVLDRNADKQVVLYDESGRTIGDYPVAGEGIDDVGLVTGVFVDGTDVYVEREHGPLVRIGDTSGQRAEPRVEIPGRPTRDGLSFITAGIIEAQAGRIYVASTDRSSGDHRFTRELKLGAFVQMIALLDTDNAGTIYVAAQVDAGEGQQSTLLSCLEPLKGIPVGGAVLPVNTVPEESLRDIVVLDDGGVLFALRSEQGVTYLRFDCE